jgi:uncharacterized repeat protein (TIGR01451 family)
MDGTTQPGWATTPLIELNGAGAGNGTSGISVTASNSTIRGLVINRFGGSGSGNGIRIQTGGSNTVTGCFIGTNAAGTAASANVGNGISIIDSPSNVIGGTAPLPSNVISGNSGDGVYLLGATSTGNSVRGNYIGTNLAGTAALANGTNGVQVETSGASNTIGGTAAGSKNVISGNANHGVWLFNSSSQVVQGNFIGTNRAGTAAVANQQHGIHVTGGATSNTVGGTSAAARNVISGNLLAGVRVASGCDGITIQGNSIGVDSTGAALGNGTYGVLLEANNASVGGTAAGEENVIANNGEDGVGVSGAATGNRILRNTVRTNAELAVDLGLDGVTANDGAKTGGQPNQLMDHPVITSAILTGSTLTVTGYVGSAQSQAAFASSRVELFESDNDPTGYGEGATYLGFLTSSGSNGNFSGSLAVTGVVAGDRVTGTATDGSGNTSEFGANATVEVIGLRKRAFLADGTPVTSTTVVPKGTLVKFLVYLNNMGTGVTDVSVQDVLAAGFQYVSGTMKFSNTASACAGPNCTGAEEATIYAAANGGTVGTDGVDGDIVSRSGATLNIGNQSVGNGQLDLAASRVWAVVFSVRAQ